jgi:branched-chain amino acid transport system substrate-binding protein
MKGTAMPRYLRAKHRTVVAGLTAVAAAAALTACGSGGSSAGGSTSDIKLGVVLSQTGAQSSLGATELKTIQAFVDQYNKQGGYKGRQIDLKVSDDQSDPAHAVDVTRAMLQSFHPAAVIGSSSTATCYAMEPVTEAAKVVQYCISGAPLAPRDPYYFSALGQTDRVLVDTAATWMLDKKFTKVGFIGTSDASGQLYQTEYGKLIQGTGLQDAGQQVYSPSTTDVTAQLTRLRSAGAQALYLGTSGSGVVTTLTGLKQLGWNVPVYVGEGSVSSLTVKAISGLLPEAGVYGPGEAPEVFDQLPSNFPAGSATAAKQFAKTWVTDLGNPPDWDAAAAYDTLNILLETVAAAGPEADKMVSYMTSHQFTGSLFTYKFTDVDHRGSDYLGLVVRFTSNPAAPFKLDAFYPDMKTYSGS